MRLMRVVNICKASNKLFGGTDTVRHSVPLTRIVLTLRRHVHGNAVKSRRYPHVFRLYNIRENVQEPEKKRC